MKYLIFIMSFGVLAPQLKAQNANEIIKKAEQNVRGNTSYSEINVKIVRPSWQRTMQMKAWSKGKDYFIILITSPARDKGTVFLKREKEVWNWVPSIQRTIKLPPSMMEQSWMGTDFTNSNLVKEDSYEDDYNSTIVGNATLHGRDCYKIKMIPKPNAGVVWGKVVMFISKKDFLELKVDFYDEDGALVNTMLESNIKKIGGRTLPTKMVMIPKDKPGHKTIMTYGKMEFNKPINIDFFTKQNMQRVR